MELSGCDACLVLEGADLDLVSRALAFGLRFKGSATCVAPRRVLGRAATLAALESKLALAAGTIPPRRVDPEMAARVKDLVDDAVAAGARVAAGRADGSESMPVIVVANARAGMRLLTEDLFAPVISLVPATSDDDAVAATNANPYALGAAVFGPLDAARRIADRLEVGCVVINDVIVPTADPRLPFGGRRASGFGVTRGAEGLLEMTAVKTVSTRRGRMRQHLEPHEPGDNAIFLAYLRATHSGAWRVRAAALYALVRALARRNQVRA
jgi:acyl-CoA reductase-like NAD-dependent aldehyde dehydrogenase